jgi:hypothetical protein
MRWAGHVVRVRDIKIAYKILTGKPEERIHLGDVDGRIILK